MIYVRPNEKCDVLGTGNISFISLILTKTVYKVRIWKGKSEFELWLWFHGKHTNYSARGLLLSYSSLKRTPWSWNVPSALIRAVAWLRAAPGEEKFPTPHNKETQFLKTLLQLTILHFQIVWRKPSQVTFVKQASLYFCAKCPHDCHDTPKRVTDVDFRLKEWQKGVVFWDMTPYNLAIN